MRAVSVALVVVGAAAGSALVVGSSRAPGRLPVPLLLDRSSTAEAELAWPAGRPTASSGASPAALLAPSTSRALSVDRTFVGSSSVDTKGEPPDPSIGVGSGFVVQTVNSAVRVWTTGGVALASYPLASFFGSSDPTSDPRVVYDAASRRWFASVVDVARASIQIAVSDGSDPTGTWTIHTHSSGSCPDQPSLGVTSRLVVVGYGAFSAPCRSVPAPAYLGGALFTYDKRRLLDGTGQAVDWGPRLDLSPVTAISATSGPARAAALALPPLAGGPTYLVIVGLEPAPTLTKIPIRPLATPPPAGQPGTSHPIATNDVRILSAAGSRGTLWLAGNDGCIPPRDGQLRSCLRILRVTSNRIGLDTDVGARGRSFFYPALAAVREGVVIVHGFSSGREDPGLAAFAITAGDRRTTEVPIASGTDPYLSDRFGDYFGAAADESGDVWVTGETTAPSSGLSTANWATAVASVAVR